ncbi:MAG: hypothetical protein JWO42_3375 [Chloroflexi bacterium]|nr:hypothetical protein [Chloroflexota bacterium]
MCWYRRSLGRKADRVDAEGMAVYNSGAKRAEARGLARTVRLPGINAAVSSPKLQVPVPRPKSSAPVPRPKLPAPVPRPTAPTRDSRPNSSAPGPRPKSSVGAPGRKLPAQVSRAFRSVGRGIPNVSECRRTHYVGIVPFPVCAMLPDYAFGIRFMSGWRGNRSAITLSFPVAAVWSAYRFRPAGLPDKRHCRRASSRNSPPTPLGPYGV